MNDDQPSNMDGMAAQYDRRAHRAIAEANDPATNQEDKQRLLKKAAQLQTMADHYAGLHNDKYYGVD